MAKPRERWQRAWFGWLEQSVDIEMQYLRRSSRQIVYELASSETMVATVVVQKLSLLVVVEVRDDPSKWDMLLSLDVVPVRVADGWNCAMCSDSELYPRRVDMLRQELWFEFADWYRHRYARAEKIEIMFNDGMTLARVVGRPDHHRPLAIL